MIEHYIDSLVAYGSQCGLTAPEDEVYLRNRLLDILQLTDYAPSEAAPIRELPEILQGLLDYACRKGILADTVPERDLFDARLMEPFVPLPHEVQRVFWERYSCSPRQATDYLYNLSRNGHYIRTERIEKNRKWKVQTPYGELEITINLSKPELPPTSLKAFQNAPKSGYPLCLLCRENEGYAGRANHPARQNLRLIPLRLDGADWYLQYSPYMYYDEHCIVFNSLHTPMAISDGTFRRLLHFAQQFPHYFIGSNADLPIVGGSVMTHDHFQGGRHVFPMEKAPIETPVRFAGYPDIRAGIIRWPMSVLRLQGADPQELSRLSAKILACWRSYSDEAVGILAQTQGLEHNTITPIARRQGDEFVLNLTLRNNLTTAAYPLGVFHPHEELHHIKKENIGLIEVMGLAVLPPRLQPELTRLAQALVSGEEPSSIPEIEKHAAWAAELQKQYCFCKENVHEILQAEVGKVFARVLEQAGVFKRDEKGRAAFLRFVQAVGCE